MALSFSTDIYSLSVTRITMTTIFVIAAILAVGALVSYALPTQVFADESETNTEQKLKQKNVGSGESTNFNWGENSIEGGLIDAQICGTLDLDLGGGMGPVGIVDGKLVEYN